MYIQHNSLLLYTCRVVRTCRAGTVIACSYLCPVLPVVSWWWPGCCLHTGQAGNGLCRWPHPRHKAKRVDAKVFYHKKTFRCVAIEVRALNFMWSYCVCTWLESYISVLIWGRPPLGVPLHSCLHTFHAVCCCPLAETAFFDPSILELLYFPDDQK